MALSFSTFTPTQGSYANVAYNLPPVDGVPTFTGHLGSQSVQLEQQRGEYRFQGKKPMLAAGAEITVTFLLQGWWLVSQGYKDSDGGSEFALLDFKQAVIDGGEGTLVENLPPNSPFAQYFYLCEVHGDYTHTPRGQNGPAIITVTFLVMSGRLKDPAGDDWPV